MTALRRNMLACPELQRLDPLLARHRLTEAETGQVVLTSFKAELSKVGVTCLLACFEGGEGREGRGEGRVYLPIFMTAVPFWGQNRSDSTM